MLTLNACPRCGGPVLDSGDSVLDSPLCLNCGWRQTHIPPDVREEVQAHLGMHYIDHQYTHRHIGTGKEPLSGWQRNKRQRGQRATQSGLAMQNEKTAGQKQTLVNNGL